MPRKNTRKNKMRGGFFDTSSWGLPDTSSWGLPDTSSYTSALTSWNPLAKKEEEAVAITAYPTEGGKKKRRRRRMRGGAYTPNSSTYGANAGPYSGAHTARAQAWVGGKSRKKRRKH